MRAAFFDIDGTLTSERTWKGLMDYFTHHRLRRATHWTFLTAHYPLRLLYRAGLVSDSGFRRRWAAHLAWYVRGYTPAEAQQVWEWTVNRFLSRFQRADICAVLNQHRQAGDLVMLVSAAPLPLVEFMAAELGADLAAGTRFEVVNGRFTGRAVPPVVIDEGKPQAVQAVLHERGLTVDLAASSAYGDSITDLSLLEMVGSPVAVYPDDLLRQVAQQRNWSILPE